MKVINCYKQTALGWTFTSLKVTKDNRNQIKALRTQYKQGKIKALEINKTK